MELREIWSTPGYFYSTAYALAAFIVVSMQPGGLKGRGRWLLHGGVLVFLMALMDLTRDAYGALFVLMETTVAATLFFSVWYTVRDGAKACFLGAKAFIYGETTASLTWMVYYFLGTRYPALQNGWAMAGISLVTAAAIAVLLYAMEGAFDGEALELEITRWDALIVLITAASVYVVSNLGYLDSDGIFGGQYAREIFTSRTLVDISGAAMLHAYTVQLREVQHRLERDALHNIMENQ